MKRTALALLALILLASTLAQAQTTRHTQRPLSRAGRWDFTVQTRYLLGTTFEGEGGSSLELKDDLGWGFGFGYNINEKFNLGFSFNWRSIDYISTGVEEVAPANTVQTEGQLSSSNFGLTGEWNILSGGFTPYVNGSFAWSIIDTNVFAGYGAGCWWDYWFGYICTPVPLTYGVNTTSYTLGAGVRYEFTRSFFARAGYEHGWVSEDLIDSSGMLRVDVGWMF